MNDTPQERQHTELPSVRTPQIAHELPPTTGLAQRGLPTSERELAMVDRIIALENKLAEANHRYKLTNQHSLYQAVAVVAPRERYARTRGIYGSMLKIPVLGEAARAGVRVLKRIRRGGR